MDADKKTRATNEYVGMSNEQLNHQEENYKMLIKNAKRAIRDRQKEIADLELNIKKYTNALHRIETARGKVGNIEYTTILNVHVKRESECINHGRPYYSPSDWREFLVYNFDVCKVNKQDFNKAKEKIIQQLISSDNSDDKTALYTAITQFKKTNE